MTHYRDDDLGGSVLIYIAAILCGIALFIVPVLLANGPTVVPNAGAQRALSALDARHDGRRFPVAKLKNKEIVDPALAAALSAKVKQPDQRRARTVRRAPPEAQAEHSYADTAPVGRHQPGPFANFYSVF